MSDLQRSRIRKSLVKELKAFIPVFEDPLSVNFVQKALRELRVTLVLGSGVSKSVGIPIWSELLDELVDSICRDFGDLCGLATPLKRMISTTPPTVMARYLEVTGLTKSALAEHLRRCLYRRYLDSKESTQILPVSQLLFSTTRPGGIAHVLTYNFDNALERCLRRHSTAFVSIHNAETYVSKGKGLRIYHPHGLLPHPDDDPRGDFLDTSQIFSERDYNFLFMDITNWANILQLYHFASRCCLFVGLSMTDPSIRRLLEFAKRQGSQGEKFHHVTIQRPKSDMLLNAFFEKDMASLGVRVLWIESFARIAEVLKIPSSS